MIALYTFLAVLLIALLALAIGGAMHLWAEVRSQKVEVNLIEPKDLMDAPICSWCQREQAIKAQPHESHGMLAEAKRFSRSAYA